MKIIMTLFILFHLVGATDYDKELQTLSQSQKAVLFKTYNMGKDYDLQWTLTAIAWKESSFGAELVNKEGAPSYGVFQIYLSSYKRRFGQYINELQIKDEILIDYLTNDYKTGFLAAIEEIRFWKNVAGRSWLRTWASYYDGTIIGLEGNNYAKDIHARIKALQRYIQPIESIDKF